MITDEEFDFLRSIADRIRLESDQTSYGSFLGGDPREFSPDPECCTPEEMERHAADCASWEAGNHVDRGPNHLPLGTPTETPPDAIVHYRGGGGHITVNHYGLGVTTYQDPTLLKLAQDLDDVIDRIRQVVS